MVGHLLSFFSEEEPLKTDMRSDGLYLFTSPTAIKALNSLPAMAVRVGRGPVDLTPVVAALVSHCAAYGLMVVSHCAAYGLSVSLLIFIY